MQLAIEMNFAVVSNTRLIYGKDGEHCTIVWLNSVLQCGWKWFLFGSFSLSSGRREERRRLSFMECVQTLKWCHISPTNTHTHCSTGNDKKLSQFSLSEELFGGHDEGIMHSSHPFFFYKIENYNRLRMNFDCFSFRVNPRRTKAHKMEQQTWFSGFR